MRTSGAMRGAMARAASISDGENENMTVMVAVSMVWKIAM